MTAIRKGERGSGSVELVLLAPVVIAAALLMVLAGRQVSAQMTVNAIAHAAARDASLHHDPAAAYEAAAATAATGLAGRGLSCVRHRIALDLDQMRPGGTITATLSCTTATTDLTGVGGVAREITGSAAVPIDRYRGERR